MMERRDRLLIAVMALAAMTAAAGAAELSDAHKPAGELVVEDFEEFIERGRWNGLEPSERHVQSGQQSAMWGIMETNRQVEESVSPSDWSDYDTLTFWCFSEKPTGTVFYLILFSENAKTKGIDYYYLPITVSWQGAREVRIPFRAFQRSRSPMGWDAIDGVSFAANWTNCVVGAGTVLYIDRLALGKAARGEDLVVSDFEWDVGAWRGLQPDPTVRHTGSVSGLWSVSEDTPFIRTTAIPHDWQGYDTLQFWLYSPTDERVDLKILLYSDNLVTELIDSYFAEFTVQWKGWQKVVLDRRHFRVSRQPKGWHEIQTVTIAAGGWGLTVPDAVDLNVDEMTLTTQSGDVITLGDFESAPTGWNGLLRSTERAHSGEASGKWANLQQRKFIRTTAVPSDWTNWDTLDFWLYSEKANRQPLLILVYSNNQITEKVDSYNYRITVSWSGWRHFAIRKAEFTPVRRPVGWGLIQNITIGGSGWGLDTKPDTVLYVDDITLRRVHSGIGVE